MIVVFIHGPPASGKHTIGALLAARKRLPLFHNHLAVDAALALFPFGSPGFIELRAKLWRAVFEAAAAAKRSFIFTFNPEATVGPGLVRDLCATIESAGGRVHFVELRCARATILERLGNASRAQFGKLTDPRLYEEIEQQGGFGFPPLPEPLVRIDTDAMTAEQAAGRIADSL
ncbi:MAG: shikimate kinase [Steroidobacteraceae bacterium]